ncbi:MAG TPA: UDP-N-acetylglucosamine 1-carboxyvinyltransferase [Thermoanaerobaculia bacterium]|nr:UDP-N-acetylglucosamine 1-carboxyvinyltransferase [Thermoanaerobaculia bacterium]
MDRFLIRGPCRLAGRVRASGAKNAALPALAASLLADEPVLLRRVPRVRDIATMRRLLAYLGVQSADEGDAVRLVPQHEGVSSEAVYEMVKTMRASVLVLGALMGRRGRARVSLPGGCAIGVRPIDQHLKGLDALGAQIRLEHGYVLAEAKRLEGKRFRFDMPTVTGTENVMMAAVLARGETVLENCAREPEIVDLANLLIAMGARIEGAGEETLRIDGVESLGGAEHDVIADRIEGGTYLVGAALTAGDVTLEDADPHDLAPLLDKLTAVGTEVSTQDDGIRVRAGGELVARDVETAPHPGFPTDLQAQYMALMTQARGTAVIRETIFENRFQHVGELLRMGADIQVSAREATVRGPRTLSGASVMATDLRASACLVLAGLAAHGETRVERIYHLDRGYEAMEAKLQALGADVQREPGPPTP